MTPEELAARYPGLDLDRSARHLAVAAVGAEGQARIRAARVHVVGAGAAAGPALLALAQAGVGAIFLEDGADVGGDDAEAWLYPPERAGELRLFAALEPVRRAGDRLQVRPWATGTDATATLVCPNQSLAARQAAELARRAGHPHAVVFPAGDGGRVVTIPAGAPCLSCAAPRGPGAWAEPGAATAVSLLGAAELLLLIAGAVPGPEGRVIELAGGRLASRPTFRRPGCECGRPAL